MKKIDALVPNDALFASVAAIQWRESNVSFQVARRRSLVTGAGDGLFLTGSARKGTAVALYPGAYRPPPPQWAVHSDGSSVITSPPLTSDQGSFDESLGDNAYCMQILPYGGFLDGQDGHEFEKMHPFAVGQFANHPPKGIRPTVYALPFLWSDIAQLLNDAGRDTDTDTLPRPNYMRGGFWFIDPATNHQVDLVPESPAHDSLLCGCALIAASDLDGGQRGLEITLDYALQKPFPPWYSPVEE